MAQVKHAGVARRAVGFAGLCVGMSASVLMQTLLAAAMPTIAGELGGMRWYSWVFAAYMLAATVTLPLFGQLADRIGRRPLYLGGISVFAAATLLAGAAEHMPTLVAWRLVQGVGAGALAPAALASVGDLFGEAGRRRAFGVLGVVQVVANLLGASLGGILTDLLGWRWGFFLIAPVAVLAALLVAAGLPSRAPAAPASEPLDWPGALLPLDLIAHPALGRAAFGTLLLGAITNGAVAFLPLWTQSVRGGSASGAGAALLPMLLCAGAGSAASGALGRRVPALPVLAWGVTVPSFALLARLDGSEGRLVFAGATALVGLGIGLLLPIYLDTAQEVAGEARCASASGVIQLARNLGGAAGVPLLGVWLGGAGAAPAGLSAIFGSLAVTAAIGMLSVLGFCKRMPFQGRTS